ncbi:MAG TPA: hypothetical protein VHK70_10565 [Burkholderiaceae bacterium]|jgi:hypothetical protein|nr:hypothetical protein [Burkholderiaceae bacterium]
MRFSSILSGILAASLLVPVAALSDSGKAYVKITSPADGAKVDSMDLVKLVYEVSPGPKGDHAHVYVDNKEVGILRQLVGTYPLESLPAGRHNLCIKVVNKAHVPIGVGQCLNVTVE